MCYVANWNPVETPIMEFLRTTLLDLEVIILVWDSNFFAISFFKYTTFVFFCSSHCPLENFLFIFGLLCCISLWSFLCIAMDAYAWHHKYTECHHFLWVSLFPCSVDLHVLWTHNKKVKVAHTRLQSVGFRSWSRFLAVSLQVTWIINPTVGCHYFPPGLQLPPQPLRRMLPVLLLGEQRHNGCEQFA